LLNSNKVERNLKFLYGKVKKFFCSEVFYLNSNKRLLIWYKKWKKWKYFNVEFFLFFNFLREVQKKKKKKKKKKIKGD
jgi:hypothetical protein